MIRQVSKFELIAALVIFGIVLSSCSPRLATQENTEIRLTPALTESPSATAKVLTDQNPTPTLTADPIDQAASTGPLLLIQTSVDTYHLLDIAANRLIPYDLPGINPEINLASMRSPDGKQLIIFTSEHSFEIFNILSKQVDFSYDFINNETKVDIEQIFKDTRELASGSSGEDLKAAIETTLTHGRKDIKWFQNGKQLFIISEGLGTSTNLALLDLTTGETVLLESRPSLVEAYWVGPSDDRILVRKGFSNTPTDWQNDQYILVDLAEGATTDIPLPPNIDNPSVLWFSEDQIGIIHQMGIVGGTDFSLVNINNMESNQIITGQFTGIYSYGNDILSLSQDREDQTTTLTIRSLDGQIKNTRILSEVCSLKRKIGSMSALLNCKAHSLMIEGEDLSVSDFGEPVFLFSRSPDRQINIVITKTGKVFSLPTGDFQRNEISLQGEPLEIFWLRDSSGFLYRTATDLYLYDMDTQTSQFVLSSALFGDYRNINAIWLGND